LLIKLEIIQLPIDCKRFQFFLWVGITTKWKKLLEKKKERSRISLNYYNIESELYDYERLKCRYRGIGV